MNYEGADYTYVYFESAGTINTPGYPNQYSNFKYVVPTCINCHMFIVKTWMYPENMFFSLPFHILMETNLYETLSTHMFAKYILPMTVFHMFQDCLVQENV